jgi:hypothetical protein
MVKHWIAGTLRQAGPFAQFRFNGVRNAGMRTNALVPLSAGYDAVITKEVAGDLSKPAQIEARSPSIGKNKAVTRAATALFMATAPHGSTNKGMEVARLR